MGTPIKPQIGRIVRCILVERDEELPMIITHVHSDNVVSGVAFAGTGDLEQRLAEFERGQSEGLGEPAIHAFLLDIVVSLAGRQTWAVESAEYSKHPVKGRHVWFWPPHLA